MATRKSLKSNTKKREVRSKASAAPAAPKSKAKSAAKVGTKRKSGTGARPQPAPKAKPAARAKPKPAPKGKPNPASKGKAKPAAKGGTKKESTTGAKPKLVTRTKSKPLRAQAKAKPDRPVKEGQPAPTRAKARPRSRKPKPKLTITRKIQDQEELARAGAHVDQATIDSATANLNPGPRMQQILQAEIAPWQRDSVSDEEAQLRELNRIPVRHVFDSDEARRRLVDRAATPGKKRFARSKTTPTPSSSS